MKQIYSFKGTAHNYRFKINSNTGKIYILSKCTNPHFFHSGKLIKHSNYLEIGTIDLRNCVVNGQIVVWNPKPFRKE